MGDEPKTKPNPDELN